MEEQTLQVRVLSPDEIVWEGEAESVSSENSQGSFDILPGHANFITASINAPLIIQPKDGDRLEFHFDRMVIYSRRNEVAVYVEV